MSHIEWSEDLSTDIPEIDKQHKLLVGYVNDLNEAINTDNRQAVELILGKLFDYTVYHFESEEGLMEEIDYKYFIPHQMTHKIFVRRVGKYKERFDAGEDIAKELYDVLAHWLIQHIKHEDQGYAAVVRHKKEALEAEKSSHYSGIVTLFKNFFHH